MWPPKDCRYWGDINPDCKINLQCKAFKCPHQGEYAWGAPAATAPEKVATPMPPPVQDPQPNIFANGMGYVPEHGPIHLPDLSNPAVMEELRQLMTKSRAEQRARIAKMRHDQKVNNLMNMYGAKEVDTDELFKGFPKQND